ncbi:hypothetical protein [Nostoc sp. FACHB-888]|uniref:hypothetical protein n=1 Tax=Nostoc sp. FACHB-888 TaxID=2692842 RepID=UPI001682E7BB|nr:hypothetical protein [Nostoc sp. FACHB-888]MBD2245404.1 hypothetical protein [Nostoc sp. FACHB-888]
MESPTVYGGEDVKSDYHMRRASAIATIVLGSQEIVVTSVAVASQNQPSESLMRVLRDCDRFCGF